MKIITKELVSFSLCVVFLSAVLCGCGENIYNYSFCAYPNFSRSSSIDVNQARKTKYFTPGEYKVAVKVSVCDPLEYTEINNDGKTETIPLYDKNLVTFLKEAYFTVE